MLELHFDGGFQIGPKSIGGDESPEIEDEFEDESPEIEISESGGRRLPIRPATVGKAIVVLGVLGGGAAAAKALNARRTGMQAELDDPAFEDEELEAAEFDE